MFESFSIKWILFVNVMLEDEEVVAVSFNKKPCEEQIEGKVAKKLRSDLISYFKGEKVDFSTYPVRLRGNFIKKVLEEVRKIPYGEVATYKEIAERVKSGARAVGQALKRNPTPIVIPCHRIVAKHGMGGFSAGVEVKRMLLELEEIL
jgi:methylated-DNA-[protein]-cysteine S-methyltransferase